MEEVKFQIKYALLGVEEQVGHTSIGWSEPIYEVCGYIVSKVYLVGETTEYFKNGNCEKKYRVVYPFPFPAIKGFSRKIVPRRAYNDYADVFDISEIFEDFEEAKKQATIKNNELENNALSRISLLTSDWKEKYEKVEEDFKKRMERYETYEQTILKETQDLVVLHKSNLEDLIAEVMNHPDLFYEAIALALSKEERLYIMKSIKNKVCNNCRNNSCRVENNEKPIENCIGWENLSLVGKIKVLH